MCAPWNDPNFEDYIRERARRRRDRDYKLEQDRRPEDRGRNIHKRKYSDMCYAIDQAGEEDFVGYSADAGLITNRRDTQYKFIDDTNSRRRVEWFERGALLTKGYGMNTVGNVGHRPFCNCAEARAMSLAAMSNVPIDRLFFVTFFPVEGKGSENGRVRLKAPCPNCQKWLVKSGGYWDDTGIKCNPKGPRDDDKGGGGGGQKNPLIVPGALTLVS